MKKHNEGYALPFVLVVLVVMCIIAVGIMDFSLRNLESQQSTIQRMEAKYEAAGQIEQIVAAMQTEVDGNAPEFVFTGSENFTGLLSFKIENGVLRVAASHEQDGGEQKLWIIAALKPEKAEGMTDTGILDEEGNKVLTIKDSGSVQYLWYEIVDLETAKLFLSEDVSNRYTPFPENGGVTP